MADAQQSWLDSLSAAVPAFGQLITEGAKAYDAIYNGPQAPAPATPPASTGPIVATAPAGPQIQNVPTAALLPAGSSWIVPALIVGAIVYFASKG